MQSYDRDKYAPELAEDWNVTPTSITFKLRKNATFHDGAPVTAKDVKWSYDRAVSVGGFPTFQMKAGSLEKPEQFVVVDDHTFRIDLIRKDNLTVPDLAVVVPAIYNSELLKKQANEKDPWGARIHQAEHGGRRRLQGHALAARHRGRVRAQRRVEIAARCRRCGASSGAWCRRRATAAR